MISYMPTMASFIAFNKLIPIPIIMIHYTFVSTYLAGEECHPDKMGAFYTFFGFMTVLSAIWGYGLHYRVIVKGENYRKIYIIMCTILSALNYAAWAFKRAKPWKCESHDFAYIFAIIYFWIIHIITYIFVV